MLAWTVNHQFLQNGASKGPILRGEEGLHGEAIHLLHKRGVSYPDKMVDEFLNKFTFRGLSRNQMFFFEVLGFSPINQSVRNESNIPSPNPSSF